jgi:hypothetical protein
VSAIPQDPTLQEVFDHVARHLLRQHQRSRSFDGCVLRAGELRCAIGCLISDDVLRQCPPRGDETRECIREAVAKSIGLDFLHPVAVRLLRDLRCVHDFEQVAEWPVALRRVAVEWDFDTSALDAKAVR